MGYQIWYMIETPLAWLEARYILMNKNSNRMVAERYMSHLLLNLTTTELTSYTLVIGCKKLFWGNKCVV